MTARCDQCGEPVERTDSGAWWRHVGSLVGPCGYRLMDSADVSECEHDDAIAGYMDTFGITADDYEPDEFEDAYQGHYDSERDFAESLADDLGLLDAKQTWPHTCIDWEHATRELMYDYASHPASGGGVHIYRSV